MKYGIEYLIKTSVHVNEQIPLNASNFIFLCNIIIYNTDLKDLVIALDILLIIILP